MQGLMLLKCIKKGGYHLTVNKNYIAYPETQSSLLLKGKHYYITNDLGIVHYISWEDVVHLFVDLNELRNEKIETILNEK